MPFFFAGAAAAFLFLPVCPLGTTRSSCSDPSSELAGVILMADFMGRTILGSTAVATAAMGRAFWNPIREFG